MSGIYGNRRLEKGDGKGRHLCKYNTLTTMVYIVGQPCSYHQAPMHSSGNWKGQMAQQVRRRRTRIRQQTMPGVKTLLREHLSSIPQ